MSGKTVSWAMEQVCGSPTTKLVLVKLADNANEQGFCFPSIDLIVEHTELSERAVRKHLYELERLGHVRIDRRSEDGVHFRNRYYLNVPAAPQREAKPARGTARRAIPMQVKQSDGLGETQLVVPQNSPVQEPAVGEATPIAPDAIPLHPMPDGAAPDATPSCTPCSTLLHVVPSHIDEPSKEPSSEPPPLTREGASDQVGEPNKVIDIGKIPDCLVRDPVELFMRAGPWHPSSIYHDTQKAMAECAELPLINELVAAAKRYFVAMDAKNSKRRKDDPLHVRSAAAFIRKAMWNDYPPPERLPRSKERKHVWGGHPAVPKLIERLGEGVFDQMIAPTRLKIVDHKPPIILAPTALIRDILETKHWQAIEWAFGMPVPVQLDAEAVAA